MKFFTARYISRLTILFAVVCLFGVSSHLVHASSAITVGGSPRFGALVGTKLYVLDYGSSTVTVIDTTTNKVNGTITAGSGMYSAVPVGTMLYIMNSNDGTVSVVDTTTDTITKTITVGNYPNGATAVGTTLYVNNNGSNSISIVDTTTNAVTNTLNLTSQPYASVVIGGKLYVLLNNSVADIDTSSNTITTTIPVVDGGSFMIADGTKLYVINAGNQTVSDIDTTTDTVTATISTPGSSMRSPTIVGNNLYVLNYSDGSITVVDTTSDTVSGVITSLSYPDTAMSVGSNLYVFGDPSDTVYIIDTTNNTVTNSIPINGDPIAENLVGSDFYTDNANAGTVSVFDTTSDTIVGVPPPVFESADITGTTLTLSYDENLSSLSVPSTSDFSVSGTTGKDTTLIGVSNVAVNGQNIVLTISGTTPGCDDQVSVSYTPGTHPIEDQTGSSAIALSNSYVNSHELCRVIYTVGPHGSLIGNTEQSVAQNNDGTPVTALPDGGYEFLSWSDGSTQNPRTDTDVAGDISVTATFALTYVPETPVVPPASAPILITIPVVVTTSTNGGGGGSSSSANTGVVGCVSNDLYSPITGQKCPVQQTGSTPSPSSAPYLTFTKNLKEGMDDSDVARLEHFLNTHNFPVATTGWGSLNGETTVFGAKTVKALKLFQESINLPATGYFGPMTRAYVNNLLPGGK